MGTQGRETKGGEVRSALGALLLSVLWGDFVLVCTLYDDLSFKPKIKAAP